jgi:hypothetical protein
MDDFITSFNEIVPFETALLGITAIVFLGIVIAVYTLVRQKPNEPNAE